MSTPAYNDAAAPEDAGAHNACTSFVTVPYAIENNVPVVSSVLAFVTRETTRVVGARVQI